MPNLTKALSKKNISSFKKDDLVITKLDKN